MAESFLSSLLSKASSLSEQKLLKGTQVQTKARVYKATDKPLSEPKYIPKKTNSIDSLLQQAKDYGTNKPQQINQAAGYLTSLYSGNLNTIQKDKNNLFNAVMVDYNQKLTDYNKLKEKYVNSPRGYSRKKPSLLEQKKLSKIYTTYKPLTIIKPVENDSFFDAVDKDTTVKKGISQLVYNMMYSVPIQQARLKFINNKTYRNMLSKQATELQDLNKTQESLFGAGFSGVDAQTLQAANWTGVKGLQAEIEKYKSLRDIYATKYANDKSETNLSYLKSYNTLVYDTSKNMVDETTRTLIAAKKNAVTGQQTKQSTISALEKYNDVLGGTTNKDVKKPIDVNTDVSIMKQQILARTNEVSGNLKKLQSSPKFEERPL